VIRIRVYLPPRQTATDPERPPYIDLWVRALLPTMIGGS
jgi:hypothetical protein